MKKFILLLSIFITNLTFAQDFILLNKKQLVKDKINTKPERAINKNSSDAFVVEYLFKGARIDTKNNENGKYQFIHIKDFAKMTQVGAPALPAHNDLILVSDETARIEIIDAEYQEYKGFNIHPALKPPVDTVGALSPEFEINEEIYNTNAFFPKQVVEMETTQKYRGAVLAFVQIRPIQFNPVTKTIRVYTKISYKINQASYIGDDFFRKNTVQAANLFKNNVINTSLLNIDNKKTRGGNLSNASGYLIISHNEYKAAADTLAKWKSQLGYKVEVICKDKWTSESVKNTIHNRYHLHSPSPDYFVIIGDCTGSYAVPAQYEMASNSKYFATDLYYACMDGEYDIFPDMAHGRISVSSADEAMMVIQKIVNYERNPVSKDSFYQNGLNCAQFQDVEGNEPRDGIASRRFCHTSEEIRDYLTDEHGYNIERLYYTDPENSPRYYNNGYFSNGESLPEELLRPNFAWEVYYDDINNSINDGRFYVIHIDHGYTSGNGWGYPYYTKHQVNQLSNGRLLPVVFSMDCHSGEFLLDNCFAETFIRKQNGGAVGIVAASYYGYSGYADAFAAGMIDAIWSDPGLTPKFGSGGIASPSPSTANNIRTMGDVVNQGLLRMCELWGINKHSFEIFHWFGDPAMKIWTENPNHNTITAVVPDNLNCNDTSFTVTGCNVEQALVTLVINNTLVARGDIYDGDVTLNLNNIGSSDTIGYITISKENHKPFIKAISVKGTCPLVPKSIFIPEVLEVFEGDSIQFFDLSINNPNAWLWSFEGGEPAVSNEQNPVVTYNVSDTFNVSLKVSNANGIDSVTYVDCIKVKSYSYCTVIGSPYTNSVDAVIFNTINNYSGSNGYEDFTGIKTDIKRNHEYNLTVYYSGYEGNKEIACWIDWNQDKDFNDPSEFIYLINDNMASAFVNIKVPENALLGETRMRIGISDQPGFTACDYNTNGEYEDYTVNIVKNDSYSVFFTINNGYINLNKASVTLNGYGTKVTDEAGVAVFTNVLPEDNISYNINLKNYFEYKDSLSVKDSNISKTVVLDSAYYSVEFYVNNGDVAVSGAVIVLDGYGSQVTDSEGQALFQKVYPANDIVYTISSANYFDYKDSLSIIDSGLSETVSLDSAFYSIEFYVNNGDVAVSGAVIILEGYGTQVTDSEGQALFQKVYPANDIVYTISSANYFDYKDSLSIINSGLSETVSLDSAFYRVEFYVNNGDVAVSGAVIVLDGYGSQVTDSEGQALFQKVYVDTLINYEVITDNYNPSYGSITVVDQDVKKTIILCKKLYDLIFTVNNGKDKISGANITINEYTETTNINGITNFKLEAGKYKYKVFAENYEEFSDSISIIDKHVNKTVTLVLSTVINEPEQEMYKIYPNPTLGKLRIEGTIIKDAYVSVYSLNGAKMYSGISRDSFIVIDITSFPAGLYIIQIEKGRMIFKQQILKE